MTNQPVGETRDVSPRHAGQAFVDQVNQHKKILYKVAYTYCSNLEDRRDLVQEMLTQLWQAFDSFDGRVQFSTWMYRVAVNVAISSVRREVRRLRDGRDTVPLENIDIDFAAADQAFGTDSDNLRTLRKLIDQLDEFSRALLMLYLDGNGTDEIADILGISPSNVTTRINRLRQKLHAQFTSE